MLPEGWREARLGELSSHIVDCEHKTAPIEESGDYFAVGTPAMRGNVIDYGQARRISRATYEGWTRRLEPALGDLLFAREAPVGPVVRVPSDLNVAPGQRTVLIRPDAARCDPRFLFHLISSPRIQDEVRRLAEGSTVTHLNVADVRTLALGLVPPLPEQRAIAEVLGALDDKIAANARLVEASSAVALALASQASTFVRVGEVAVHARSQVTPADMKAEVVHHYSLPAFDAASGPDIVAPGEIKSSKFLVIKPSVLVSKLNPRFPRIWDVSVLDEFDALASTEFVVLEPHSVSSSLLWALIAQPAVSVELEAQVAGTSGSHQRVKPEAILAARIGNPSTLSEEVRDGIESCTSRAHAVRRETSKLIATRDALLPALMSGRLTVRDAEAVAAGAGL